MSYNLIQTFSGKMNPVNPNPDDINIVDIAHGLSNVCRYTGQCRKFYSVAEHSVRVSEYLTSTGESNEVALYGLLHDASEAYLADVATPVKTSDGFSMYRQYESSLQCLIYNKFGLSSVMPKCVDHADRVLLNTERLDLMSSPPEGISWGDLPDPIPGDQHFGLMPEYAENSFLNLFRTLYYK